MVKQNTNSRAFKIIALRVMEGCAESLRKVLKPDTTYFFCNEYEDDGFGRIRKKKRTSELSPDFFRVREESAPRINISCVVGLNGDGKSSLIELLLRTLNNFSYMAGYRSDHEELCLIPNLYIRLFYSVDGIIYEIDAHGRAMELMRGSTCLWKRNLDDETGRKEFLHKKEILKHSSSLFYTIVSNYSLYAYNSEEYKSETSDKDASDSWITKLFYKNDAYQTPLVLIPKRERGVIDVNREYELSLQRLSELFLVCPEHKYHISESEIVEGFAYRIENESKLINRTILSYILDEKCGARDVIVFNSSYAKNRNAINLEANDVLLMNRLFWDTFDSSFYDTGLLSFATDKIKEKREENSSGNKGTDLFTYLTRITRNKSKAWDLSRKNISVFLSRGGGELTFLQFQRLFLVFEVYSEWTKRLGWHFSFPSLSSRSPKDLAIFYLVYKTIRIIETYPAYISGGLSDYEIPQHFFNDEVRRNNLDKWFASINWEIKQKTHFTYKLRQIIFFIAHYDTSLLIRKQSVNRDEKALEGLKMSGFESYMDARAYYESIRFEKDVTAALPPPIYKVDYLISKQGDSFYPLSRMSSGERQLLNSVSSIIYHLKNVNKSRASGTKLVYNNINIVLEEVELYFHPEYQRLFIKYLLEQIGYANLGSGMAINFIFVTHSPFILSDVPRQNVLFLKNGFPDRSMQEDTFGANIHTMLQNGFFLSGVPIGEFAKDKIASMFKTLNKSEQLSERELTQLSREIPLVSEPLLRNQLMRLYSQRKGFENGDVRDRIEYLENRINHLESLLNDNNTMGKLD